MIGGNRRATLSRRSLPEPGFRNATPKPIYRSITGHRPAALRSPRTAVSRKRSSTPSTSRSRPQHDADAAVFLVLEHVVGADAVFERQVVGYQHRRVQIALPHIVEELPDVAMPVLLRSFHCEPFVGDDSHRELVGQPIDTQYGDDAALAAGQDRLAKRGGPVGLQTQQLLGAIVKLLQPAAVAFHADSLDTGIGTPSAGSFPQCFLHAAHGGVVDRFGTELLG